MTAVLDASVDSSGVERPPGPDLRTHNAGLIE
jgi:hypothetical protein